MSSQVPLCGMPRIWAHQLHGNESFQHGGGVEHHLDLFRFGFESLPYRFPTCKFSCCSELFPGSEAGAWCPGFGVAWVLSLSPPCSPMLSSRVPPGHRPWSPPPQISSSVSLPWMSGPVTPELGICGCFCYLLHSLCV